MGHRAVVTCVTAGGPVAPARDRFAVVEANLVAGIDRDVSALLVGDQYPVRLFARGSHLRSGVALRESNRDEHVAVHLGLTGVRTDTIDAPLRLIPHADACRLAIQAALSRADV